MAHSREVSQHAYMIEVVGDLIIHLTSSLYSRAIVACKDVFDGWASRTSLKRYPPILRFFFAMAKEVA